MKRTPKILMAIAMGATLAGCGTSGASSPPGTPVDVRLNEFTITPSPVTVEHGSVRFSVTNAGKIDHEMVVMRTDLAPNALPTEANGDADEHGAGVTSMGEVDDLKPGAHKVVTLNLPAGHYVLMCNQPGHYHDGMEMPFTVN